MLVAILSGAVVGFVHVFAAPDHLAAILPLAASSRRRGFMVGIEWGVGHMGGVLAVGLISLLLKGFIPFGFLEEHGDKFIGALLLIIGAWAIWKALTFRVEIVEEGDGEASVKVHIHDGVTCRSHIGFHRDARREFQRPAAVAVGIVSGLIGSGHILGILPAFGFSTLAGSIFYLVSFASGSILAMALFAAAVGALAVRARRAAKGVYRWLLLAFAVLVILIGVFLVLGIGIFPEI